MSIRHDNGECRLQYDTTTFRVTAGYTPTDHIYAPSSPEVWDMWLPVLGPTTYLLWLTLVSYLDTTNTTQLGTTELTIDLHDLARRLGTSPSRLRSSIERLTMFHLAHTLTTDPTLLHVRRAAPPRTCDRPRRFDIHHSNN